MLSQQTDILPLSPGLIPADPLGQALTAIFNYPWHHIYKDAGEWLTATRYPISPRILWEKWQAATELVGVRFGKSTLYALLDIDINSPFHPDNDPAALASIKLALESIGIYRTVLIRSSQSRGLHLYIPLNAAVETYGFALAIKYCLEDSSFFLAGGELESFPNCKTYQVGTPTDYNGHRLPLQSGSFLLGHDGEILSNDLSHFLKTWECAASGNDLDELNAAIAVAVARNKVVAFRSVGRSGVQWKTDNEKIISEGWTDHHQTNELIKVIARHGVVFLGLAGDELIDYVIETAIASPGYEQFCNHKTDITRRARDWSIAAQRYYRPYKSIPTGGNLWQKEKQIDRRIEVNSQASQGAIDRIKTAVLSIAAAAISTVRELAAAIAAAAKCSLKTLYKHKNIWHPTHKEDNSYNLAVEGDTALDLPQAENTIESLEPSLSGLLHPSHSKKVLNGITEFFEDQPLQKTPLKPPSMPPGFDFGDRASPPSPQNPYQEGDSAAIECFSTDRDKNSLMSVGCPGCCFASSDLGCEFLQSDRCL